MGTEDERDVCGQGPGSMPHSAGPHRDVEIQVVSQAHFHEGACNLYIFLPVVSREEGNTIAV